jgi:hypothetical protein
MTMVWDCLIVELLWLHQIQSLANVTMATIAIGKVGKLVLPRTFLFFFFFCPVFFHFTLSAGWYLHVKSSRWPYL